MHFVCGKRGERDGLQVGQNYTQLFVGQAQIFVSWSQRATQALQRVLHDRGGRHTQYCIEAIASGKRNHQHANLSLRNTRVINCVAKC